MKSPKTWFLAGVSLLATTASAWADPIFTPIAFALFAGPLGGVLSFGAIYTGIQLAAVAAVAGLQYALGANQQQNIDPGQFKNVFEDSGNQSEIRAIGRVRVGGLKAFGNTSNFNRYRLICHTKGKWTATEEHFLGGREVTVEADGTVSSPPWARSGGSFVTIKSKIGDGTELSWPELISTFPALWTAAHRVRGIAQSLVKYVSPGINNDKFLKLYQGGEPAYERVGRAEPVYDPRVGIQSATNPATWAWDDNGILCAAHILRSFPSISATDLDYADIALEATKAETLVPIKVGTQERCRAWGFWPSESQRGKTMEDVLRSIGAEIVATSDNRYSIRLVDDVRVPELTFTARDIIDLQLRSGPESVERPNVCRVKYYSPERNYEMAEIDLTGIPWARVQTEIDRVGEQYFDVDLPFCPSASQAQRIARRLFALARADTGIVTLNFAGLAAWGLPVVAIEFPDLDITETCAIGTPRVNDEDGTVEIPFVVWPDLEPWNPATMEAAAPDVIPDLQFESNLPTPAAPAEYALVVYPSGARETRIRYTGVAGGSTSEANYRAYTAEGPNSWGSMTEYTAGGVNYAYGPQVTEGMQADFRVRWFNSDEEASYFSDLLSANPVAINNATPAAPTLTVDMTVDETTATLTVSVSSSQLRVRSVSFQQGLGAPTVGNVRPGQAFTGSITTSRPTASGPSITVIVNAYAYTSNGTISAVSSVSKSIPRRSYDD
ncbi:phage tail protein [Aminobacter aminovorans]|uniref:phage tail protein n=1 Tax=Aminobacter aminovorans TaxID=83263 RepID=UPI0028546827|nr:phage tail protein [Aminobacter aminovorans]MDR7220363.1 hypothetical protein [Aminobacter aminovorans]